ncbi:hypothetical protein KIOSHI_27 [Bacillus phage Kioshi]|nr:hypothetical protein KIOSHI_27 [Bacillus phage Kioshi]
MIIVVNRSELSFEKAREVDALLDLYNRLKSRIESNVEKQLFGLVMVECEEINKVIVALNKLGVQVNPSSVW